MSFFQELKRRNVFRVGLAYAVGAWVLLQIVDFVLDAIAAPGWILQVFLLAAAVGLPVVLVIAWVFEMTSEGIRLESGIDRSQSITPSTGRKLDRVIIVFLAVAVVLLLVERFIGADREKGPDTFSSDPVAVAGGRSAIELPAATAAGEYAASEKSIAVLPFVNMSSDPEQEFFSDGVAEEILNVLTRIPNLKVAARTSSFKFKGKQLDAAEIGQQLQVNHLLEGSVRKSGNTLRITAQLIDTHNGFHLWSRTFDRQLEDVFAIQGEIAAAIATELRASLSAGETTPTAKVDIAAYELYLKGRGLVAQRKESSLLEAIELLQSANRIDAEYAPAMAMLATAYAVLPWFSVHLPTGEARELARGWASKALLAEPDNSEALAVLGLVKFELDMDWGGARSLFEQALEINPGNVTANNFYGDFLLRTADFNKALIYESKAAELDPLAPVQLGDLANVHLLRGEYDQAITLAKRALELDPQFDSARQTLITVYHVLGDVASMEAEVKKAESPPERNERWIKGFRFQLLLASGDSEGAKAELDSRLQFLDSGQETDATSLAFDLTNLGEFDRAGELLLRAYAAKDGLWMFPFVVRLPEQAPDSEPWLTFWRQPGVAELAEIRRSHGFSAEIPAFGGGAKRRPD